MYLAIRSTRALDVAGAARRAAWICALFGLAIAPRGWAQQWPVPEFVSLDRPANFENGALQLGGQVYAIDMVSETDDGYAANIVNGQGATLYMSSPEEAQIDVVFTYGGEQYSGSGFSKTERASSVIANFEVAEFQGALFDSENQRFPAVLTVTESLMGGGDSQLQIEGEYAYLSGDLGTRTYNQIFNLIHNHPNVRMIVEQNVSGSVNDEINMQTGRLIRRAGLATHIPAGGEAHSGGVDLFCAGAYRSLAAGAKVGVHSWSDDDVEARFIPADSPQHAAQIAYFEEMLGSPTGRNFYFFTLQAAPADGMHLMTPEEITHFGLVTH